MPRSRFKTCFISAPFGADTSVLRKILEENSISWRDLTKLNFANNLIIGIDEAISKSDFICAMMPEGENPNILFEMGLAYARHLSDCLNREDSARNWFASVTSPRTAGSRLCRGSPSDVCKLP